MIQCEEKEVRGKKLTIAKFLNEDGDDLYSIWFDSLERYYYKITSGMKQYQLPQDDLFDLIEDILKERKLVGIAKLADGDTYNLEEGRRVARADLIRRYNLAEAELATRVLNIMSHDIELVIKKIGFKYDVK